MSKNGIFHSRVAGCTITGALIISSPAQANPTAPVLLSTSQPRLVSEWPGGGGSASSLSPTRLWLQLVSSLHRAEQTLSQSLCVSDVIPSTISN